MRDVSGTCDMENPLVGLYMPREAFVWLSFAAARHSGGATKAERTLYAGGCRRPLSLPRPFGSLTPQLQRLGPCCPPQRGSKAERSLYAVGLAARAVRRSPSSQRGTCAQLERLNDTAAVSQQERGGGERRRRASAAPPAEPPGSISARSRLRRRASCRASRIAAATRHSASPLSASPTIVVTDPTCPPRLLTASAAVRKARSDATGALLVALCGYISACLGYISSPGAADALRVLEQRGWRRVADDVAHLRDADSGQATHLPPAGVQENCGAFGIASGLAASRAY